MLVRKKGNTTAFFFSFLVAGGVVAATTSLWKTVHTHTHTHTSTLYHPISLCTPFVGRPEYVGDVGKLLYFLHNFAFNSNALIGTLFCTLVPASQHFCVCVCLYAKLLGNRSNLYNCSPARVPGKRRLGTWHQTFFRTRPARKSPPEEGWGYVLPRCTLNSVDSYCTSFSNHSTLVSAHSPHGSGVVRMGMIFH